MVLSSRKVYQRSMTKGLVISVENATHHKFLVYIIDGYQLVRTRISHGADHDLSPHRISEMAAQYGLSRPQFINFINCTLSAEEFHQIQLTRLAERLKQQPGGKTKHTKK